MHRRKGLSLLHARRQRVAHDGDGECRCHRGRYLMHYVRVILCAGVGILVLGVGGCTTPWTISPCEGTDYRTPCMGPCKIAVDDQAQTLRTVPLAVVIRDHNGRLHCEAIQP
jgi:hypothetical protein